MVLKVNPALGKRVSKRKGRTPKGSSLKSLFGALGGNRTPDALLRTEALYPLSYEGARLLL